MAKLRVEFGRSSGDVDGIDARAGVEEVQQSIDMGVAHHLCALWASIDVAVSTRLIAALSEIDLKCGWFVSTQCRLAVFM